jgi:hypothetical protein
MIGMTLTVWLMSHPSREGKDPSLALAVKSQDKKSSRYQGRKSGKRPSWANHRATKKPAPPSQKPGVRLVKAKPVASSPPAKPVAVPLDNLVQALARDVRKAPPDARTAEKYGTSVAFFKNPLDADLLARKEDKLRFVLHVSGNFEDPGCT